MQKVLTPIQIGPMKLKNRVFMLAMAKYISNPDRTVSDREIAYYTNFAKNGVGMVITGISAVDGDCPSKMPCQMGLFSDDQLPGLKKLVDSIHAAGAKVVMQPWHPGKAAYGCSADDLKGCADWTVEEIHEIQQMYIDAIVRIQKAGADGFEMHIAHNYLPQQFLVPAFNKRTDEYGAQTVENGLRFSTEIIAEAKRLCGPDFAVIAKINATDMGVPGGMDEERLVQASILLEKAGVQLITVSAGGALSDITGMSADGHRPEGWKVPYAEAVKKAVNIPVAASGSIRHPDYVEKILSEGKCDMIGMARGLLAEPEWVKKLEEGRETEIRSCISCMNCFSAFPVESSICSVNPYAGREILQKPLVKDGNGRVVAVIGAGPAGLEAAVTLAERGFKPVVFEKSGRIGGNEYIASCPDGKHKLGWHIEYYIRQVERLQIPIYLNTMANTQNVQELNPYAVIVATGSDPVVPRSIPGILEPNVLHNRPLLECIPAIGGKNIVVVGAGLVGLETAVTLSNRGNKVTVIDMQPAPVNPAKDLLLAIEYADKAGVQVFSEHQLKEIRKDAVDAVEMKSGQLRTFPADKTVICMGAKANNAIVEDMKKICNNVQVVGDAVQPRKIVNAVQSGREAAEAIH